MGFVFCIVVYCSGLNYISMGICNKNSINMHKMHVDYMNEGGEYSISYLKTISWFENLFRHAEQLILCVLNKTNL